MVFPDDSHNTSLMHINQNYQSISKLNNILKILVKFYRKFHHMKVEVDWLQSLKQFFINVSYHIFVASLTLFWLVLKTVPSELD